MLHLAALAQPGLGLPEYASALPPSGAPLRGGRAFVARKPAQCAALLPCCLEPPLLGLAIRYQTARGGTPGPLNVKRALPHQKQAGDGTPAPEEALAQPQPLLPSPSGYCSCVSRAMEVCCLLQAGDEPTPCSQLAGQCPFDPRGACGRLMFGFWEQLLSTSPSLTLTLHKGPALHCQVMDGNFALRLNCSFFQRMTSAGVAALLVLRWLYFSNQ